MTFLAILAADIPISQIAKTAAVLAEPAAELASVLPKKRVAIAKIAKSFAKNNALQRPLCTQAEA